jgi:hypothetical protein
MEGDQAFANGSRVVELKPMGGSIEANQFGPPTHAEGAFG